MMEKEFLIIYFIFINLLSFILFAADKRKAKNKAYRIRESLLLFTAFIGGAFGALISMILFRHKTQKIKFTLFVPLFLIAHVFLGYYLLRSFV